MRKNMLKAIGYTIISFAVTHLLILSFLAITTGNFTYINLFAVLDLQEFFPGIEKGIASGIASSLFGLVIFCIFYFKTKKR